VAEGPRGILLCGGSASRFGSDKLLAPFRGAPLVAHSARHLVAGAGNALAVIPLGAADLRRALEAEGCDILESADTRRGLGASLAAAVAASPDAAGWIVALGDMPLVRATTIAAVRAALEGGAAIAAPVHGKARGHPVGFSREFGPELRALDCDTGARALLCAHAQRVAAIEVEDPGTLADIDVPADLDRHR
jgi:molybdenum cofactor cytidylyltransferase